MADPSPKSGEIDEFLQFDVVSDYQDHHFRSTNANSFNGARKKIMQEWKILERNLPETIVVRVYEQRIDLLRAAIIGAAGTPYHDGLFFFDIAFPIDYPNHPPMVHYHSFGLRLNPNLYNNGKVCLSLLNTWTGKKIEKWNPSNSSILQLLVSIQGLVLNEAPFFNEPAARMLGRALMEKSSMIYSEHVFILSLKTMLFVLNKLPVNFENFVREHFRKRGKTIMAACNAYVNCEVRVGYYREGDSSSSSRSIFKIRKQFEANMVESYPRLYRAFNRVGASLEDFDKILVIKPKEKVKHKLGIKIIGKIKKFFGFKKKIENISI